MNRPFWTVINGTVIYGLTVCSYVDRLDQAGTLVAPGETQDPQVVIDVDVKPRRGYADQRPHSYCNDLDNVRQPKAATRLT